ncbi:MAG TPA: NAD(P)-dependent oxidoreductase [Candidatus Binataceae bacterium]|nr:NAD(P)-dependent oxidoreductase [Candidatus Binataceae bacterium]
MATRVGFIGLGQQGLPMAVNLCKDGFDLAVYDVRSEPVAELVAIGARGARSPAEAAAQAESVAVIVLDDTQVEEVVLGRDGILGAIEPGGVIVIHSTIRPRVLRKVAALASARQVEVIDAAVGGNVASAISRTMTLLVGGEAGVVARCRPMLACSAPNIQHLGPLGAGLAAKLAHQVILALNILGAAEGMSLGAALGIEPRVLQDAIRTCRAQSLIADNWADYRPGSHGALVFHKDLTIALEVADELGLAMPGAALVRELIPRLMA